MVNGKCVECRGRRQPVDLRSRMNKPEGTPEGKPLRGNDAVLPAAGRVAVAGALLQRGCGGRHRGRRFPRRIAAGAIFVYDNNSTDHTAEFARAAGAEVRRETHQGKGNVVRRMFSDVDADIYVLVDGDATYDARAPAS